jgi:hypothetical protein
MSDYELQQSDYAEREPNEQFVPRLIEGLQVELTALKRKLSDTNYTFFIHSLAHFVVGKLEA